MGLPRRFKGMMETTLESVIAPEGAWITFSVCSTRPDACGWQGWILESLFLNRPEGAFRHKQLVIDDRYQCPACGLPLYRTAAKMRFSPAADQTPDLLEGIDYIALPPKYED
jgi:hypothetical protein